MEMLDRALALARIFMELPFEPNLWQAQNIWYEILRSGSEKLTLLIPEDQPRWTKGFRELAACLSIDYAAIETPEVVKATAAD